MRETTELLIWKSSLLKTTEFVSVTIGNAIHVQGHVTSEDIDKLFHLSYTLDLDTTWNVQSVHIDVLSKEPVSLSLTKDRNNNWYDERGVLLRDLSGCNDVDISYTPFTNTLPINRLHLPVGATKEETVVYVDIPTAKCTAVPQRYTNLGEGFYLYENLVTGFKSKIEIDEKGYVVDYPGIWGRVKWTG